MNNDLPKLRAQRQDPDAISQKEIRHLFRLCSDTRRPGAEQALEMLLAPGETGGSPAYYLRLAALLAQWRLPMREIPRELLSVFYELIACAGSVPNDPALGGFFRRIVTQIPETLLRPLLEKRFPATPFILFWDGRRMFPGSSRRLRDHSRRRWRILRRRLLQQNDARQFPPALEVTTADLKPLLDSRRQPPPGLWKRGSACLLCPAGNTLPDPVPPLSRLCWGGGRSRLRGFWDRLAAAQARELSTVGVFARTVSKMTKRVVLSWHNASLAAAGGWGVEDIAAQFPGQGLYREFAGSVRRILPAMRSTLNGRQAEELCASRTRRILGPKIEHALGEMRHFEIPAAENASGWERVFREAPDLRALGTMNGSRHTGGFAWQGAVSPHQQVTPDDILAWYQCWETPWLDGLALLFALTVQGQAMLDSGALSSFVLPWIDKFFISSRRKADKEYPARLFRLVEAHVKNPLILFWEDTAHSRKPSLGLALEELAGEGLPFAGIGIFDSCGSDRRDAMGIISAGYPRWALFALRPVDDGHYAATGNRIVGGVDRDFLQFYDSSWKDNLAFIYAGTQVFPLLSVQTEMETVTPWVSTGHKRCPFGAWFRRRMRREVLGVSEPSDPLALAYSEWANLL